MGDNTDGAGFVDALRILLSHASISRRDPYAGWAHLGIFYGFVVLFIGTVILAINTDFTEPVFGWRFFEGNFYLGYSVVLDVLGLALLVGIVLMMVRRGILRPRKLDYARPDRVAGVITYATIPAISAPDYPHAPTPEQVETLGLFCLTMAMLLLPKLMGLAIALAALAIILLAAGLFGWQRLKGPPASQPATTPPPMSMSATTVWGAIRSRAPTRKRSTNTTPSSPARSSNTRRSF